MFSKIPPPQPSPIAPAGGISYELFMAGHTATNSKQPYTHTRIGNSVMGIRGGLYNIPDPDWDQWLPLYWDRVITNGGAEYLTELQRTDDQGPIVVDFDFRYSKDVVERPHTVDHLTDMVSQYLEEMATMMTFDPQEPIYAFIMERDDMTRITDVQHPYVKDGIHMLISVQASRTFQVMLRERMMSVLPNLWADLPLTNGYDTVLDEGISKGQTNWCLYGSRKPGLKPYVLTQVYRAVYDSSTSRFRLNNGITPEQAMNSQTLRKALFASQPALYRGEIHPQFEEEYQSRLSVALYRNGQLTNQSALTSVAANVTTNTVTNDAFTVLTTVIQPTVVYDFNRLTNEEELDAAVEAMMGSLTHKDHLVQITHEYTQTLPEAYYRPGSHDKNVKVAMALKYTDDRLFLSWIQLRSKAVDFDYGDIPNLYERWTSLIKPAEGGLSARSIRYWSERDAPEGYLAVRKRIAERLIDMNIMDTTDYGSAEVLHAMKGDEYMCVCRKPLKWMRYKNNRWVKDDSGSLRTAISTDMYIAYQQKATELENTMMDQAASEEVRDRTRKRLTKLSAAAVQLKQTARKNNIMVEATDLFYDEQFDKIHDDNPYLMCFENGVVDFKTGTFRAGRADDYLTLTTGCNYIDEDQQQDEDNVRINSEINDFMSKLFPEDDLRQYMWEHLASACIGVKEEQTFNAYLGSGSNGKSKMTQLVSTGFGDYYGTAPLTLITGRRAETGATSSEVACLKHLRYACMQEPSKGTIVNEGKLKEVTGGDPLQCRQLYKESETFRPQFTLSICTNDRLIIDGNSDAVWRRMREVPYKVKFIGEGEKVTVPAQYTFPKDPTINEAKFQEWKHVFMSRLVQIAFRLKGHVNVCHQVMEATEQYRRKQNIIATFMSEKIRSVLPSTSATEAVVADATNEPLNDGVVPELVEDPSTYIISKTALLAEFKKWYTTNATGNINKCNTYHDELIECMNRTFGPMTKGTRKTGWSGCSIIDDEEVLDASMNPV
jgi:P4 family phage/plasmid primase-like protien